MICPNCGATTHSGRKTCPECGASLLPDRADGFDRHSSPSKPRRGRGKLPAVLIVALVLVVAAGALVQLDSSVLHIFIKPPRPTSLVDVTQTPAPTLVLTLEGTAVPTMEPTVEPTMEPTVPSFVVEPADPPVEEPFSPPVQAVAHTNHVSEVALNAYQAIRGGSMDALDPQTRIVADAALEAVNSVTDDGMTDYEKELALHDFIVDSCDYYIDMNRYSHDVRGFFLNGIGQCSGYCDTFWLLGSLADLEVAIVSGTADSDLSAELAASVNLVPGDNGHAWNVIRLDGQWYALDVTWDDPISEDGNTNGAQSRYYNYFNVPYSLLSRNHHWDGSEEPEGSNAPALDQNYRFIRMYDTPQYRVDTVDEGVESAMAQMRANGEAYLAVTNSASVDSIAESIQQALANRYNARIWLLSTMSYLEFKDAMPFLLYRYYPD